jgi:hypothetical protein
LDALATQLPWYNLIFMTNREIADALLRGKKKKHKVESLKAATAIRVAGHRLGGVITVRRKKKKFVLFKSKAKVWHRTKKTAKAKKTKGLGQ